MASVPLVQNFSLPGEISRKFALDWSADNKISICTSKAIYILNSYSSPVESGFPLPLHKQVIPASDQALKLIPLPIPQNPYKHIKSAEDRENLFNVLMDHTLNPTPPERAEAFRSFRCCRWSPKGAVTAGRCLLATLSMDHRLCLYEENDKEWKCLCDLTELLKHQAVPRKPPVVEQPKPKVPPKKKRRARGRPRKIPREEVDPDYEAEEGQPEQEAAEETPAFSISRNLNYQKLMAETYKYAPMEIAWTGMFNSPTGAQLNEKGNEFCFLIVAMKSGRLQFWKVSPNDGRVISLVHEYDTELGMITSLSWQQTSSVAGFLMCGTLKGILAFLPVAIVTTDQEAQIVVKSMCKVWDEEDLVAVDHIAILKVALRKYIIISAKLHTLVGCEIILTEKSIIIRNVGHSFGLHRLPVTGMAVLDTRSIPQFKVLLSTMEGVLVEVKVSLGKDEIKFQHDLIKIDLDLKNNMIQGVALSANGLLCGVIMNTSVYFDHLEKKEPLQFAMFVTKPFEDIQSKLKVILKQVFPFLPYASDTISNHTDYLEVVRIHLAQGKPLPDWMSEILDGTLANYDSYSATELYFMRFLIHAYVSGLAVNSPKDKEELTTKLYSVESMIMRNHISKVFRSCQDNLDLLTPGQGQSLLLMADWLFREYQMPVDGLYSALGFESPSDPDSVPARETCDVCKGEVRLDSIKEGQCANKHKFARCCQSLLLCDVAPYHQCHSCKSVALRDIWNLDSCCTYCGMDMQ